MGKLKSSTGYVDDCEICKEPIEPYNGWTFERENDDLYLICKDCGRFLVGHLLNHYPESIDIEHIKYLKEGLEDSQSNEETKKWG